MKARLHILLLAMVLVVGPVTAKPAKYYEELPAAKLAAMKKKPCTLLHVWATWCTTCLQELPDLLKALAAIKGVTPVVIDVSSPFVQNNFSKKWMASLKPPFKTYLKPDVKDAAYLETVDKDWSGGLPFSALYHKGKRRKVWNGSIDLSGNLSELRRDVAEHCR